MFKEMFEDATGGTSNSRVLSFIINIGILITWGYVCYVSKQIVEIPQSVLTLALGSFSLKVVQRVFGEKTEPEKQ